MKANVIIVAFIKIVINFLLLGLKISGFAAMLRKPKHIPNVWDKAIS